MAGSLALSAYLGLARLIDWPVGLLLWRRMRQGKEDPARIGERRGVAGLARPPGRLVWLHGASIGEAMSILPLVDAILKTAPDTRCLVTTGTVTSAARMARMLPAGAMHQYVPVDTDRAVRRFLDHWRPDLAIWVESEFWPCLLTRTARRGVPMALVNARLSEKSARSWARVPGMISALLAGFRLIVAQDGETVARIKALTVRTDAMRLGGNLKALAPLPEPGADRLAAAEAALSGRPVWLAASTHPGEEEAVLAAHGAMPNETLLILAPRHPERAVEVAALARSAGFETVTAASGGLPGPDSRVWLADVLGEMGLWLRLAPVTFVGGSLAQMGGHTPFEPALLGSAILHGPNTQNFALAYDVLRKADGAIEVQGADDLSTGVAKLLADGAERGRMTDAARALFDDAPDPLALARELLALTGDAP